MKPFHELLAMRRGSEWIPPKRLLCLDPGETTGWSVFEDGQLVRCGQAHTIEGYHIIHNLFCDIVPSMVIYENYRVYAHKLERHSNSEVYTLRLIGAIEYLCDMTYQVPRYNQMAQQAKGFVTDEKLKAWGYYQKGQRHSRDSMRHGCYFLLFDKSLEGGLK